MSGKAYLPTTDALVELLDSGMYSTGSTVAVPAIWASHAAALIRAYVKVCAVTSDEPIVPTKAAGH